MFEFGPISTKTSPPFLSIGVRNRVLPMFILLQMRVTQKEDGCSRPVCVPHVVRKDVVFTQEGAETHMDKTDISIEKQTAKS